LRQIKQKENLLRRIATPLLGLLFILPFIYFQQVTIRLIAIEERQLEALTREKLLLEAEAFQADLAPEKYVESALRKMNLHFGLTLRQKGDRPLTFPAGFDPQLIDESFIPSAKRYLEENFGFAPSIFLAADTDLKNTYHDFASGILPNFEFRQEFTRLGIFSIAFDDTFMRNILPDTRSLEEIRSFFLSKYRAESFHMVFSELFQQKISIFSSPMINPDSCKRKFSNHFGNIGVFDYAFRIPRSFADGWEGLYGLYYLLVSGRDVSPVRILKHACENTSNEASRAVIKSKVVQPYFVRNRHGLFYYANLPSSWFQSINDYCWKNPHLKDSLKKFFHSHSICTFADSSELISPARKLLSSFSFLIRLLILFLFTLTIIAILKPGFPSVSLNQKLRLAISAVFVIPLFLIFFTVHLIDSVSGKLQLTKVQTQIHKQMRQFSHLEKELSTRTALLNFDRKSLDSEILDPQNFQPDRIFSHKNFNHLQGLGNMSLLLNSEGDLYSFSRDLNLQRPRTKTEAAGLFRILNGLGYTNPMSAKIKKLTKEQYLLGSFGDEYWKVFATSKALASENEIIHDLYSVSTTRKCIFQLLARKSSPKIPFAIFYHVLNDLRTSRIFFNYLKNQQRIKSRQFVDDSQIDFAVFSRMTFGLRNVQWPDSNTLFNPLKNVAEKAMELRTSGSSTESRDGQNIFLSWVFKEDSPLVLVAYAQIGKNQASGLSFSLLAWLFAGYGVIAILFCSNGLEKIFLGPVKLLMSGVDYIKRRNYQFQLQMKVSDEFADLGQSFNRMSSGLLQNEKMRRFVSDKLIESINSSVANQKTRVLQVVVLSCDIRDFTTISEKAAPEELVTMLNEYLSRMEQQIRRHNGSVDKIVGDAIVASFSSENQHKNLLDACKAGLAMRQALKSFNIARERQGLPAIENGVGIAAGQAIFGVAGREGRRREMVMIGKPFQISEELEALSKFGKSSRVLLQSQLENSLEHEFKFIRVISENHDLEAVEIIQ
jgi:class 3 adenylate cyclase